jgi:hypothetical protein
VTPPPPLQKAARRREAQSKAKQKKSIEDSREGYTRGAHAKLLCFAFFFQPVMVALALAVAVVPVERQQYARWEMLPHIYIYTKDGEMTGEHPLFFPSLISRSPPLSQPLQRRLTHATCGGGEEGMEGYRLSYSSRSPLTCFVVVFLKLKI